MIRFANQALSNLALRGLLACAVLLAVAGAARADGAGPLLKLLQSGRLPAERQPTVVEMVCKKGNADDLAYVFSQVVDPQAFAPELRLKSLVWLADAAKINKVRPAGDLSAVGKLLAEPAAAENPAFALAVIRLASAWQVANIASELQQIVLAEKVDAKLQAEALAGLASIGDADSRATIEKLAAANRPIRLRFLATAALAGIDLEIAAKAAAAALADASPQDDPGILIQAFLERQQGTDALAKGLAAATLKPDVAKQALRTLYTAGRSDKALSDVLSRAAGIALDVPPPTGEELNQLVAEVVAKGDPARGERVFRRGDVNCLKCHSVSGGGGTIGPDLSPVGGTSPVEYVVNSILNPNLAIKEAYMTKNVITADGKVFSGIVVDRNDQEIKLKDALGNINSIATADIDEETEGKSFMPQGLTKFLTHDELLDLARFVSELGKPGPYGIRSKPSVQRWRVLKTVPEPLVAEVPNIEFLRQHVLAAPAEDWLPAFGMAGGVLPLDELKPLATGNIVYLQGMVDVVEAGAVGVKVQANVPLAGWLDATPLAGEKDLTADLAKGQHTLTLRVVLEGAAPAELQAEFFKPDGSAAQFRAY